MGNNMSESEDQLKHVFWLGGSPCSGKSSIGKLLAGRFDLDLYRVDEAFGIHAPGLDPAQHPALAKWCASSWDERWMQSIDKLVQDAIACYLEHFALIREDILSTLKRKPLLVEGTALLPRQVAGISPEKSHAVWLIPTANFQREYYAQREWALAIAAQCSDPEVAFHNWMERDVRFAEWVEAEATALNLQLLKVDGSRTIEENAEAVAAHFRLSGN
jgi:hypothetical protein